MSHVDKSERRRQNGHDRDGNGNIGNGSTHKTRAERYRNNYTNNKKNISPKVKKIFPKKLLFSLSDLLLEEDIDLSLFWLIQTYCLRLL